MYPETHDRVNGFRSPSVPELTAANSFREPPNNIHAEQALLGAILTSNAALDRVPSGFKPEHFFGQLHADIFEAISHAIQAGRNVTAVTLASQFAGYPPVDDALTVPQYLGRLTARATTIINVRDYAQTVMDLALRRSLIVVGEDLVNTAYDSPVDFPPEVQIEEAESRLAALVRDGDEDRCVSYGQAAAKMLDRANAAYSRAGHLAGLSTGLVDLDSKLGGLANSDLIILAGRPAMGKTALATNIAVTAARAEDVDSDGVVTTTPVGFFSLEMSAEQLVMRIAASDADLSSEAVRRGTINEVEFRSLVDAAGKPTRLHIDDRGGVTFAQLRARARRMARRYGIKLLIVDYLQLIQGSGKRGNNRVQDVTEITTGLKALAKELQVPVIALSQLNRGLEGREDKRPQLADLRESGSIEQDADVVMFVYREEYYLERQKPAPEKIDEMIDWEKAMLAASGRAECIIGKQRHGPTGTIAVAFDGPRTRFSNLAADDHGTERRE